MRLYHVFDNFFPLRSWWSMAMLIRRRVWRYQRGNQNPYIEEEQTTAKGKGIKGQTAIYKTYTLNYKSSNTTPIKNLNFCSIANKIGCRCICQCIEVV